MERNLLLFRTGLVYVSDLSEISYFLYQISSREGSLKTFSLSVIVCSVLFDRSFIFSSLESLTVKKFLKYNS